MTYFTTSRHRGATTSLMDQLEAHYIASELLQNSKEMRHFITVISEGIKLSRAMNPEVTA